MSTLSFPDTARHFVGIGSSFKIFLILSSLPCRDAFTQMALRTGNIMKQRNGAQVLYSRNVGGGEERYSTSNKRIVFIRHGRTYMNDLIDGIHFGKPGFTDVFPDTQEYNAKYFDSPLSPTGLDQVKALHSLLHDLTQNKPDALDALALSPEDVTFLEEIDLVVTSPLTRALQTLEMGLHRHLQSREVPILALPQAAERIYLVSDLGLPRSVLSRKYTYVDFETEFHPHVGTDDPWHYVPSEEDVKNYLEWRPHGEGQVYACLGEPQHYFDRRMSELYRWLESREEGTIAVVCHAGVIHWMTQEIFENCELRIIPFEHLKPQALMVEEEMFSLT